MSQTLASILDETDPEPLFSQLVHDHLILLLKEFEHYISTAMDPETGMEWIRDPFVNKSGESTCQLKQNNGVNWK